MSVRGDHGKNRAAGMMETKQIVETAQKTIVLVKTAPPPEDLINKPQVDACQKKLSSITKTDRENVPYPQIAAVG